MKIGVLIPTRGDRPQFLEQTKKILIRQTLTPDVILIFDESPKSDSPDITYRYRKGCEQLFAQNCDVVFFIEDDDWYANNYIEFMSTEWEYAGRPTLFGINKTLYYNIHTQKYAEIKTKDRASMMSMCASPKIMDLNWPEDADPFTDYKLAQHCKVVTNEVSEKWLAVGIKHGIGKCGGIGHKKDWEQYKNQDVNYKMLRSIIGPKDVEFYKKLIHKIEYAEKEKIKLSICTAIWKRPEVFELFAIGIHKLEAECDMEINVIVAGSEGMISRKMVEKHGFIYVEIPNDPLATKMNATTLIAKQLKSNYILCIGSDDIISPELMKVYESYMKKGIDYIGVTDFYFYDLISKRAAYWGGYLDSRKDHTVGAGRLISSYLMNQWNWMPWEIKDSHVLDNSMQNKLKNTPHTRATFSLKEKRVYALDIKSDINMTPFQLWDNTTYITTEELKKQFPFVIK